MKVKILAVGKEKSPEMRTLTQEYLKRLPWKVEILEIEPSKTGSIPEIKDAEGLKLLAKTGKNSFVVILDEKGTELSSHEFADLFGKIARKGLSEVNFIIGGAHGHGDNIKKNADLELSLSKMTLPHKFARIILCEQIYRAYSILENHPYHK